jgi:hypothetical protein
MPVSTVSLDACPLSRDRPLRVCAVKGQILPTAAPIPVPRAEVGYERLAAPYRIT